MASVNTSTHFLNNTLEPQIRQHLKNVYACLAVSTVAAAVGALVHLFTNILQAGIYSTIAGFAFFFLLIFTPDDDNKAMTKKMGYLIVFSVLSGVGIGPLLEHIIQVDSRIVVTALIVTSAVFASFSLYAILSERGKWLFLGKILFILYTILILMSFSNIIYDSTLLWIVEVYLGLLVMCGYILYDTQALIEKRMMGSKDVVAHTLDLFVHSLEIYKKMLIIMT